MYIFKIKGYIFHKQAATIIDRGWVGANVEQQELRSLVGQVPDILVEYTPLSLHHQPKKGTNKYMIHFHQQQKNYLPSLSMRHSIAEPCTGKVRSIDSVR